jgi:hypothetical protein
MPAAYYDDDGNHLKQCSKCKEVLPVDNYYRTPEGMRDGYQSQCRSCILAGYKEQNRRRSKKRKQRTYKLSPHHVEWIREQKHKMSTRETAKEFAKKFHAMRINPATVHRIFTGELHPTPDQREEKNNANTVSIYDVLDGAKDHSGSVEDYLDSLTDKKIKY